jgi:hypothetical protein
MKTEEQLPTQVLEEDSLEKEPVLSAPEDRSAADWAERATRAREAREMARKLRKGKRILFPSMHSQNR